MHLTKKLLLALPLALATAACTNIDCPLDNVVALQCGLYQSETGAPLTLSDTLTVRAGGVLDTVLLNRAIGLKDFQLPVRQGAAADTLLLRFANEHGQAAEDSIIVGHEATAHFESLDCPATFFHTLTAVRWTSHALGEMPLTIDRVEIVRPQVNYDNVENLRIYLRSTAAH